MGGGLSLITHECKPGDINKIKKFYEKKVKTNEFPWIITFKNSDIEISPDGSHNGDIYYLETLRDFLKKCSKYNAYLFETFTYTSCYDCGVVHVSSYKKYIKLISMSTDDGFVEKSYYKW